MKAQLASKNQLLSIMSKKQLELEGRLDEMLSRIAKETQEIKDLEQELTEGKRHCSDSLLYIISWNHATASCIQKKVVLHHSLLCGFVSLLCHS